MHTAPRIPLALVVTADDFGIGVGTSRGIIRAHRQGPVTATSLMTITGQHVRASVGLLADAPDLDVGLHVVLTDCGHPPLVAGQSSGLVGRDGRFLSNGRLWRKAFSGRLNQAAVAEEIAAQAELFHELLGRRPAFVDGHHHAHQLPIIRDALLGVIRQGLLPPVTRITVEAPKMIWRAPSAGVKRLAAHFLGRCAAPTFRRHGLFTNDFYFGILAPRLLRRDFPWQGFLNQLPDSGVMEWVVHPGMADDTLIGRDDYRAGRVKELESLTHPQGVEAWGHLRQNLTRKSLLQSLALGR
ncbi:MAG: ChbG/HpnK family deacetylase [Tepidisphaeraceae bacterium]